MAILVQGTDGVEIQKIFPPAETFPTIGSLINVLVKNIFVVAGLLLFLLLIFAGVQFIVSSGGGDEKQMEQSRNAITAALIGFALIFAAYWIVQIIEFMTGVSIFNPGV